ncbi:ImmA/IrrE family metallo-endopeptidase [Anaerobacillus sp. MEB173]|uniref:ImmA/IrrE family metallo-endopeptidase n=1 Tax=Anaerobacillus sp. MEB173 TaxID=3383345 RepID=UPI003F90B736
MNLALYKTTPLEEWIYHKYQANGIYSVDDLDMEKIITIFGGELASTKGTSHARWIDDGSNYFVIFLNTYQRVEKQRYDFFHELCHPLKHVGSQPNVSKLFNQLQEVQAGNFQLYAALPIYMLEEFNDIPFSVFVKIVSEAFALPEVLVTKRMEQIKNRITYEENHQVLVNKIQSQYRKADPNNWSYETKELVKLAINQKMIKKGAVING